MKRFRLVAFATFMVLATSAPYAQNANPEQMQSRFKQMQTLMDQASQAKTPAERQKLMDEHMKLMQEQMTGMRGMMGPGGMMGQPQASSSMDTKTGPGMQAMQQRMDMMQGMMEQMLKQHSMMKPPQ